MITKTTGEDSESQKRLKLALSSSPEPAQTAEVVQMVRAITPEPVEIKKLVKSLNTCVRSASAPPVSMYFTSIPATRKRTASEIPSEAPLFKRRKSIHKMPTIEQSPEKAPSMERESEGSRKMKREGGKKRKTYKRKRRVSYKL